MTSPLVPLASNDLFGGGPERKRGAHSSRAGIQVSAKSELLRCHVIQLSLQRGATQPANHATLTVSTGTKPRHERDAQLFCLRDAHPQRSVRPNRELSLCREPPNVELTGRREFIQAGPEQSSCEKRCRRSGPTICSAAVQSRRNAERIQVALPCKPPRN